MLRSTWRSSLPDQPFATSGIRTRWPNAGQLRCQPMEISSRVSGQDLVRARRDPASGLVTTAIAPDVGELIATDYAARMVEQLEARVRAAGLSNVRCERA